MAEQFFDWYRSHLFGLADPLPTAGRLQAKLPIRLVDNLNRAKDGATPFELLGPGDVAGLNPSAITARYPRPGVSDAEATKSAHVEFSAADLPWRYSASAPEGAAAKTLRPWLLLVVGTPDEVVLGPRATVELHSGVLSEINPQDSFRWAHVQTFDSADPVSRIVCPRTMKEGTEYVAALVPAWRLVGAGATAQLADSWTTGDIEVSLPCFDAWRFTTASGGDFAQLAERLQPVDPTKVPDFGVAHVRLRAGDAPPGAAVRGALALAQDPPADAGPLDPAVTAWMSRLTGPIAGGPAGRWILTLPDYGGPWPTTAGPPPGGGWRAELASDPRRRVAAGLGAWAALEWQDRIAEAAAAQAGSLALASARIRHLTAGLAASRSLWRRRVPPATAAVDRLVLLAPLIARLPAGGGSVQDQVAGRTPRFASELFSSAARRVLRPGTAWSTYAQPGASDPAAVFLSAGNCPDMADPDPLDKLFRVKGDIDPSRVAGAGEPFRIRYDVDVRGLLALVPPEAEPDPCRPVDVAALGAAVADAVDPTVARPMVVERVLGSIAGLSDPLLAPPDFSPELDLPLWSFLSERARDWLLPGVGGLAKDQVAAVSSNPVFVDAFLLGANVQALGELRWRNIPVTTGWTPLRRFWNHIDAKTGAATTDIRPVSGKVPPGWSDQSPLGDDSHDAQDPPPAGGRNDLVVVFRSELFHRYPTTLVYLAPALRDASGKVTWDNPPDVDAPGTTARTEPVLTGNIGPGVTFFGFPVPPSAAGDHWVVLEEPPPGVRFRAESPANAGPDAASYAVDKFAKPVRVFLGELLG